MRSRITSFLAVGFIAVAGLAYADNDAGDAAEDAKEAAAQGAAKLTMGEAVVLAEKEVPGGRVIDAEVDTENGIVSYVIDIEKDGVQTVMIDVATGEVISVAAMETDDLDVPAAKVDNDDEEDEDDD
jgi:uncharacterized membrane protein YkoI